MRKLAKAILKLFIRIEVIPFNDLGIETEIHTMTIFGKSVKPLQIVKPIEPNDELCEYLGII